MRYNIGLTISYEYASQVSSARHHLRLMPQHLPDEQRLVSALLTVDPPPSERIDRVDFFGNPLVEVTHTAPHKALSFSISARVDRLGDNRGLVGEISTTELAAQLGDLRSLGARSPHHFTAASTRIARLPMWHEYAREVVGGGLSVRACVEAIGLALHRDMRFDPQATTVATPPEDAFTRREGVCQDYSQIMIGCLRALGIPAGYASGYLRTEPPEGQPRLEGADAMHAWVCAWCGTEAGWVEYDPTNATFVGTDHVVIARGRDYADASPVIGSVRVSGETRTSQAVDVIPLD